MCQALHRAHIGPLYQSNSERQTCNRISCTNTVYFEWKTHAVGQDLFQTSYCDVFKCSSFRRVSVARHARHRQSFVTRNRNPSLLSSSTAVSLPVLPILNSHSRQTRWRVSRLGPRANRLRLALITVGVDRERVRSRHAECRTQSSINIAKT